MSALSVITCNKSTNQMALVPLGEYLGTDSRSGSVGGSATPLKILAAASWCTSSRIRWRLAGGGCLSDSP